MVIVAFFSALFRSPAQGLVNFVNDPATLISVNGPGGSTAINSPAGAYYFALLTAPPGTTQPSLFAFSGVSATNAGIGRINGGIGVPVPGWAAGTRQSFMVFGWPASGGPIFNPQWLNGSIILPQFGMSAIGIGVAGGIDSATGQDLPALPIFGGATSSGSISAGFSLGQQCLSCNPPQIALQPQDQLAREGMNVELGVGAVLTPELTYQWFANNNPISGGTNFLLELTNVPVSLDGTEYYAVASNPWGTARSSTVTLNVSPAVRPVPALSLAGQPGTALEIDTSDALGPSASWSAWQSVVLAGAQEWFFDLSEPALQRFYRTSQSSGLPSIASVQPHLVPTIQLAGAIGAHFQVNYLGQSAPTNTWVPLATVVLTNTSQFYFDTSGIGKPPRFYRLIPQ